MGVFIKEKPTEITEYDESVVLFIFNKVTIHDDKFTLEFNSGVVMDVDEYE